MRVGYFCLQSTWPVLFAQALDLIEEDLEAGREVHVAHPSASQRFSDTAPFEDSPRRQRRELRSFWAGVDLLSAAPRLHGVDALARRHPLARELRRLQIPRFASHQELNDFRFHGHDAGNAVLSSLIWSARDSEADLDRHRDYVERALQTSIQIYVAALAFIERLAPDRVTVLNGRMATFRGVLRACQETGIRCLVHEVGAGLDRVGLTEDTMPHDTAWLARQIEETWEKGPEPLEEKRAIGRAFYERKRRNDGFDWIAYTRDQEQGRLPFAAGEGRPVYSVFPSSECERIALPQYYRYLVHESQLDAIVDVASTLEAHGFPGLLCVRLHPNSVGDRPDLLEQLQRRLDPERVLLIPPGSPVDTYALIDASEKVFTFGSTLSMEAAYWGKPTVSFANSGFDRLDSVHHPTDRDEARRLIVEPLEPRESEDTLKYGYHYAVFGRPLRHAEPVDLGTCFFKGAALHEPRSARRGWRRARLRSFWRRHLA